MANTISIIIPAYNAEKDIPDLIRSLEKQTVDPLEMILVDDCSTDNTRMLASEFFKVVSTRKNSGPGAARNLGMKVAQGEYFGFLDADCRPAPDWVEQVERRLARDDVDVLTGGFIVKSSTVMGQAIAALGWPCGGALGFEKMWRVLPDNTVEKLGSGNCVIRRSIMEKMGGFDESFSYCFEDAHLAYRLGRAGIKIKYFRAMDVGHTPRESVRSFIRWHYNRGKGINLFKQKVGKLKHFFRLRVWSSMNIVKTYYKDVKLPLILSLLLLSVIVQQYAALVDRWRMKH